MKKRLLAMLMVLSMALSILPMSAMAAPGDGGGDQEAANQIAKQGEEKTTKDKKVKHSKRIEQTDENTLAWLLYHAARLAQRPTEYPRGSHPGGSNRSV